MWGWGLTPKPWDFKQPIDPGQLQLQRMEGEERTGRTTFGSAEQHEPCIAHLVFLFTWLPQFSLNNDERIDWKTAERPEVQLEVILHPFI